MPGIGEIIVFPPASLALDCDSKNFGVTISNSVLPF